MLVAVATERQPPLALVTFILNNKVGDEWAEVKPFVAGEHLDLRSHIILTCPVLTCDHALSIKAIKW